MKEVEDTVKTAKIGVGYLILITALAIVSWINEHMDLVITCVVGVIVCAITVGQIKKKHPIASVLLICIGYPAVLLFHPTYTAIWVTGLVALMTAVASLFAGIVHWSSSNERRPYFLILPLLAMLSLPGLDKFYPSSVGLRSVEATETFVDLIHGRNTSKNLTSNTEGGRNTSTNLQCPEQTTFDSWVDIGGEFSVETCRNSKGRLNGPFKSWYLERGQPQKKGNLKNQGNMENGRSVGIWKGWDKAGNLQVEFSYRIPDRVVDWKYYKNNKVTEQGATIDDEKVGTWYSYSPGGAKTEASFGPGPSDRDIPLAVFITLMVASLAGFIGSKRKDSSSIESSENHQNRANAA